MIPIKPRVAFHPLHWINQPTNCSFTFCGSTKRNTQNYLTMHPTRSVTQPPISSNSILFYNILLKCGSKIKIKINPKNVNCSIKKQLNRGGNHFNLQWFLWKRQISPRCRQKKMLSTYKWFPDGDLAVPSQAIFCGLIEPTTKHFN